MQILPGFTGIIRFYRTGLDSFDFYLRFGQASVEQRQTAEFYLPVYAGRDIRQIYRSSTVDHVGTISGALTEGRALQLYNMARFRKERMFDVEVWYYSDAANENAKRMTDCIVSELQFRCTAGEIVSFSMTFIGEVDEWYVGSDIGYTVGQKLVTWDKTGIVGAYDADLVSAFTYQINNSPLTIKTGKGLHPRDINPTIQEVTGSINVFNLKAPYYGTDAYELGVKETAFHIDNWSDEHKIVFDPQEETPLTSGAVISAINWTRVDDFS